MPHWRPCADRSAVPGSFEVAVASSGPDGGDSGVGDSGAGSGAVHDGQPQSGGGVYCVDPYPHGEDLGAGPGRRFGDTPIDGNGDPRAVAHGALDHGGESAAPHAMGEVHHQAATFFSLMIAGLAHSLPATMCAGLQQQGVSADVAHQVAGLQPSAACSRLQPMAEIAWALGLSCKALG
jgi:hypothetical protein